MAKTVRYRRRRRVQNPSTGDILFWGAVAVGAYLLWQWWQNQQAQAQQVTSYQPSPAPSPIPVSPAVTAPVPTVTAPPTPTVTAAVPTVTTPATPIAAPATAPPGATVYAPPAGSGAGAYVIQGVLTPGGPTVSYLETPAIPGVNAPADLPPGLVMSQQIS